MTNPEKDEGLPRWFKIIWGACISLGIIIGLVYALTGPVAANHAAHHRWPYERYGTVINRSARVYEAVDHGEKTEYRKVEVRYLEPNGRIFYARGTTPKDVEVNDYIEFWENQQQHTYMWYDGAPWGWSDPSVIGVFVVIGGILGAIAPWGFCLLVVGVLLAIALIGALIFGCPPPPPPQPGEPSGPPYGCPAPPAPGEPDGPPYGCKPQTA